jgi:heme/copper-type cytochrome/quinol oxidase subunit 2
MEATVTTTQTPAISLRKAAFIAGLAVLVMALTVPVVEFYIFPTLIDYKNAAQTTKNIINHTSLFSTAIFIHFITVICDVIVAWALYVFLKPVNQNLALLVAWFRMVYTAFNVAALLSLIQILASLRASQNFSSMTSGYLDEYVSFHLHSFQLQWQFGLVFFGIYLCLLSYLVFRADYIPKLISVCLAIAGLGYLVENLKHFFYPNLDTGFLWFTFFGELVFMFWLLIKGSQIQKLNKVTDGKHHPTTI